jgi:hypothetical protein
MNLRSFALALVSLAALVSFSGCLSIQQPANMSTVSSPVAVRAEFRSAVNNSIRVELDGADVTSSFQISYPSTPGTITASLPLTPGAHRLVVRGEFIVYWLLFPIRQAQSQQVDFTVTAPPAPTIGFTPSSLTTTASATTNVNVTLSQAPAGAVTVNLSSASGAVASVPATVTIGAGATSSPAFPVNTSAVGSTTINGSAMGYTAGSMSVTVNPGLTVLTPAQGPVGTTVTFTGTGFAAGASVRFGNTNGANVTIISPTTLTATVPAGLAVGNTTARVTVAGNNSTTLPFAVLAPPAPTPVILFRTSAQDVQTFRFTPASGATPASFALVDTENATAQGGVYTVGLAQTATTVVRSSPADVQAFTINTPPGLTLTATRGGFASGTGSAAAISGSTVVRAIDAGIQVGVLNAGSIGALAFVGGTPSATGVAVDILGTTVVRAHSGGIDLFDVSNPAAPVRLSNPGSGGGDASAVGTGVRFVSATRVVRTFPQGIELYDVSTPATPTRIGVNRNGFVDAAMGTAVAVEPGGAAVIRATSLGLERYLLAPAATLPLAASRNGRVSTTGVGVVVIGTRAFRATNDRLEAYDLPALPAAVADIAATVSAVGVGLSGR